jgi:hypothetical protein
LRVVSSRPERTTLSGQKVNSLGDSGFDVTHELGEIFALCPNDHLDVITHPYQCDDFGTVFFLRARCRRAYGSANDTFGVLDGESGL